MDATWTAAIAGAFGGLGTSVTAAVVNHRLVRRQEVARERRQVSRETASDLTASLRDLRALLARLGRVELPQSDVARVFLTWTDAFDRQQHLLPNEWPHLASSVRAAVGTVFGAVSLADVRTELETYPLADPDFEWQDHAYSYLNYLLDRLSRWGNAERVEPPLMFDPWLEKTGRRMKAL